MSTPFADALSLCNLASVGIFGIVLSAAFCELEWTRQRKLLLAGCTVLMLALQGVVSLRWSRSGKSEMQIQRRRKVTADLRSRVSDFRSGKAVRLLRLP